MNRISERFRVLRERGERAFVPFITAGDPDLDTTRALVPAMAEAGADIVEIGVPFSDPIADGPTIQRASGRALARGVTLRRVLELVKALRQEVEIPILLMGYANPFFAMGAERFAESAREVGVDGIIVPDLPPEEGAPLYDACRAVGIDGVLMAAPTTTRERLKFLARASRGFLYTVSLTGVTGARAELASGLEAQVRDARAAGDLPVCVGFGISRPEHAEAVGRYADGVVVGGAIVDRIEASESSSQAIDEVSRFVAALKEPLRRPL